MKAKSGFTLVEILIVVVILGILAAIVIPQFTDASTEANESRLASDLQMMRSQIELYKIQHLDQLPDITSSSAFATDMTVGDSNGGPYMHKVPTNPFNNLNTVVAGTTADGSSGWMLNNTANDANYGRFFPNDSLSTPDGDAHSSL